MQHGTAGYRIGCSKTDSAEVQPARFLGQKYAQSKHAAEVDWFTRDYCYGPDTDSGLEPTRDR